MANNLMMDEYQKTFEERLLEEKEMQKNIQKKDYSVPHLTNLNEDPQLSGKIYHNLIVKKTLLIGKGNKDVEPDIILRGIGV